MTKQTRREIGERLVSELPNLDYQSQWICGCDPTTVVLIERVPWVHCFEWGWHDPQEPHPDALYWPPNGDGAVG